MIKLFASDLDGTLLNENHKVDEIIEKTIQKVHENKKIFCIATGRSMYENHVDEFKNVQGLYYCLSLNGAVISDQNGHILYKRAMDKDVVYKMLKQFPHLSFECLGLNKMYFSDSKEKTYQNYLELVKWSKFHQAYTFERFYENAVFGFNADMLHDEEILKVNCRIYDEKDKIAFTNFIHENSDKIVNAPFIDDFFELTDIEVNKGNSLMRLIQMLDIDADEVAVYGDGVNDLTMLGMFFNSYAPLNAADNIKKAAKGVVDDCKDHGVCFHILNSLI